MLPNTGMSACRWRVAARSLLVAVIFSFFSAQSPLFAASAAKQKTFPSPEEAVKAVVDAVRSDNLTQMLEIFGADGREILLSGDAVADKQRREQLLAAYNEKNSLVSQGEQRILVLGKNDWPLPIPLVKKGDGWIFDSAKGKEEILNRRIGDNELYTIQVMLALVDAQREYAGKDRDGDGLLEYARRFRSEPGKKNGLYWEAKAGEEQSPLGPLFAQAQRAGYAGRPQSSDRTAQPYHGYHFKILTAQGKDAPGGAFSYLVKGKLIGGFALVGYPAKYGNSGIMTFIVNHQGKVFEKNLGAQTAAIATTMKEFNPDKSWGEIKE